MNLIKKILDLLLYSNLWVAFIAIVMCLQTQFLLFGNLRWSPLLSFLFFATLFIYAIHRILGLKTTKPFQGQGRFQIIAEIKPLLMLLAGLAALAGSWFYFQLGSKAQYALIFPCLIGAFYVLPVLGKNKRLRDFNYLKIFVLTIAWAWITVGVPALEKGWFITLPALLILLERSFFIFALTLAFDIRDMKVDTFNQVKTIPSRIGIPKTRMLAGISLFLMLIFSYFNFSIDAYSPGVLLALVLSAISSYLLIHFADTAKHDYYFSGLMDGAILVQFLLIWGLE